MTTPRYGPTASTLILTPAETLDRLEEWHQRQLLHIAVARLALLPEPRRSRALGEVLGVLRVAQPADPPAGSATPPQS